MRALFKYQKGFFKSTINNKEIKIAIGKELFLNISPDCFLQIENISKIKEVASPVLFMPDIHRGYDVPIGSVFATDSKKGIISSNAVGYDINCGIRLVKTNLVLKDLKKEDLQKITEKLKKLPLGLSSDGLKISKKDYKEILTKGVNWAVSNKYCIKDDLKRIYNYGFLSGANPSKISKKALKRGFLQIGTLGQGNHFIDILKVDKTFDKKILKEFNLVKDQIVIMIHTGSRGLGHQIATDYFNLFKEKNPSFTKEEISYFNISSKEGKDYYKAMAAAANFGFVNRIILDYNIRKIISSINLGQKPSFSLLYDLSHNLATFENHFQKDLLVIRKGASRVFLKEDLEKDSPFKKTGTPIILPGSMLDDSYILVPEKGVKDTYMSVAHGSGRSLSRKCAKEEISFKDLKSFMDQKNVILESISQNLAREEQPNAYKSSLKVVRSLENANLVKRVCSLKPLIVLIG